MSSRLLHNLLAGEFVHVKYDPTLANDGDDGKMPAYLYRAPDGLFVNLELIRQGCSLAVADQPFEHDELFGFYEAKAQGDGKGIWKASPETEKQQDQADQNTPADPEPAE